MLCCATTPTSSLTGEPGAWDAFEAVLRSPLPVAFRFTGWDAAALHPAHMECTM